MDKETKYIKLNSDDILEILLEHFQKQFGQCEAAKGIILGTPEKDLRFIGTFGQTWDDDFGNIDLEEVDKQLSCNGDHAFWEAHPEFCIDR